MHLFEHERQLAKTFSKAGIESPDLCARSLVIAASGIDRDEWYLKSWLSLSSNQAEKLAHFAARRLDGEPLAYILGKKAFYEHDFLVNQATLIPRPETELIVDTALRLCLEERLTFLDAGCGSGCIGLSLLDIRKGWSGILLDTSSAALDIANLNCQRLSLDAVLINADMAHLPFAASSFSLVVANPPYIADFEKDMVMKEVLNHEPHTALFSPESGLWHLKMIAREGARVLKPGGRIILEHGACQGESVAGILSETGYMEIEDFRDLANLSRCCTGIKKGGN